MKSVNAIAVCLVSAFLISLHQYIYWNEWFTVSQLHHETWVIGLVGISLGIGLCKWKKVKG